MKIQKIIAILALVSFFLVEIVSADELADMKNTYNSYYLNVSSNLSKITSLQNENENFKKLMDDLSKKMDSYSNSQTSSIGSNTWITTISNTWVVDKVTNIDKYNQIIYKINSMSWAIFSDNNIGSDATIWLFEFIDPDAFFISIDDWKNPTWVTWFKTKILYNYDSSLNFKVVWVFSLDYSSWYYTTKSWKNPYSKWVRIRVKNPAYKWKLLDIIPATSSQAPIQSSSIQSSGNNNSTIATWTDVTLDMVKSAYSKNKIADAIKFSDLYILKDPNNIDVLRIRYRSYYMLWKYVQALAEIQKIESLQWTSMIKTVACDWSTIARLVKNTDLNKKYWDICKSK